MHCSERGHDPRSLGYKAKLKNDKVAYLLGFHDALFFERIPKRVRFCVHFCC